MQLTPTGADATTPAAGLASRVFDRLDARLEFNVERPVVLALSGGGDSMALLDLAALWAARRGRRLLAVTVDHGLNPDSGRWNAIAARAAAAVGVEWRGIRWEGPRPSTGLPAAARAARHALIADVAREAGARVMLFAHTSSDVAEADWMRARGSSLGRIRAWAPSPAWPQGRGLMLLRPLLPESRERVRTYLAERGLGWVEDPGNVDPRYARSRARQDLAAVGAVPVPPPQPRAIRGPAPKVSAIGIVQLSRAASARTLATAAVCAGGGSRPPRGERLTRLLVRLAAGEDFTAAMCGARIEALGPRVTLMREAGEFVRFPPTPQVAKAGGRLIWDGRFELATLAAGTRVVAAAGRLAQLSPQDRLSLTRLPAAVRPTLPVLIREGSTAPVLAGRAGDARCLVGERLALALDETTHETGLGDALHGAKPPDPLFSL
ncbi:tRNA lysidine(34) synthetase TilS [uncultured Brevundimonas sp.]|mgnify:FL=1|uniref:tRNA lysidine(34) synthetase TilS n=1 Tax=uncultured Brevundimonas sp. TaxID=213418 RepID=UPI0030EE1ACB